MDFGRVCVMGLGYIGLPTAAMLASKGLQVSGVDIRPDVVDSINRGEIHIVEHDLDVLVRSVVQSGHLGAALVPSEADVFLIVVPTPFTEDHQPDLRYVEQATLAIAPHLLPGNTIILESTSPVGTTAKIAALLHQARPDLNIPGFAAAQEGEQLHIAYCPERVLPGKILTELINNDRIVGGIDQASAIKAQQLYKIFCVGEILLSDARTAEMTKLTENAFRDVNIAFANELANICDTLEINVWELIKLANHHPRVNILQPGPGVGGHCIAVDPWFIIDSAPEEARLIRTAREVNDARPDKVLAKILAVLKSRPDATIACLGLAFKADVDDLRESPAMAIVEKLAKQIKNKILVVEPYIKNLPKPLSPFEKIIHVTLEQGLHDAQVIVVLVGHKEFAAISTDLLQNKTLLDICGLWKNIQLGQR